MPSKRRKKIHTLTPKQYREWKKSRGAGRKPKETRLLDPKKCAKGSFRTLKRGTANVVLCCLKGKWDAKREKCKVGLKTQHIQRYVRKAA